MACGLASTLQSSWTSPDSRTTTTLLGGCRKCSWCGPVSAFRVVAGRKGALVVVSTGSGGGGGSYASSADGGWPTKMLAARVVLLFQCTRMAFQWRGW